MNEKVKNNTSINYMTYNYMISHFFVDAGPHWILYI